MGQKTRDFRFEIKAIREDGTFDGYGSVFNVKDLHSEIVAPGAFTESLQNHKSAGTMPAMLWQHRADEPIGIYTAMGEDGKGLKLSGQLALKTARGSEAYEFLKIGAVSGLSIGFTTKQDTIDRKTGIRTLNKVDLWECSLVTFPANDIARVQSVKSIETIREAEDVLRDSGFSRAEAVAFIGRIKSLNQRDAETDKLKALFVALESRNIFI
jgi:HK97 family phage prohead protease